eukprot:COSAG02_NODE_29157_length_574_cov_23.800000_1_plen_107_part_01
MAVSMLLRPATAVARTLRPQYTVWRRTATSPAAAVRRGSKSWACGAPSAGWRGVATAAGELDQWGMGKEAFKGLYPQIIADINEDVRAQGMPPSARQWVERMVNYTL